MRTIHAEPQPSLARVRETDRPRLTVGLVQTRWHEDPDEHVAVLDDGVASAAASGAEVVFAPELTLLRYPADTPAHDLPTGTPAELAEPLDGGPTYSWAAKAAATHGVLVHASLYEQADDGDGLGFNTAILVAPDGTLLARTRKLHIPVTAGYFEDTYFRPGPAQEAYPVTELELPAAPRVGLPTCWDEWFPEVARAYSMGGAEVLAYPTAIGSEPDHPDFDTEPLWRQVIVANGISNGLFMVVPNRWGSEGLITFYGSSFISDPYGRVLVQAPREGDAVLVATLDLAQRSDWLELFPFLTTRRPDTYGALVALVDPPPRRTVSNPTVPAAPYALVRRPAQTLADGIVTFIERQPLDLDLAREQWRDYVAALESHGWRTVEVEPDDTLPDSVFVEDAVVMFGDLAVVTNPAEPARNPETAAAEKSVRDLGFEVLTITDGTLDGGDILKVGSQVYAGITGTTTVEAIEQLRSFLEQRGWTVTAVPVTKALHLKSAITALPDGTIVGYGPVVDDASIFERYLEMPEEPGAHVVVLDEHTVLMSSAAPRSAAMFRERGLDVVAVGISEFEKLEGCVTCPLGPGARMSTLYVARQVHTLDAVTPSATGVLVEGERVIAVGDAADLRGGAGHVVDLGDAVVTPGLVDGHSHPVMGLSLTAGVDLTDILDLDAVRARLAEARDALAPGEWLRAWALNPVVFGREAPSAAALGPVLDGIPAYVILYDGHSAIASGEALRMAGIDAARDFASSARIDVDADGHPTGWLLEQEASGLVEAFVPEPSTAERAAMLDELLRGMAAVGYTGLHAMDFQDPAADLLTILETQGDLPLRYGANPMLMPDDGGPAGVLARQGEGGRRWRVEGVKLVVDGTVDGGTAWLEYADTHGESLTSLWRDVAAFREAVTVLHQAGVNCSVHAIGDRGVREVLEVFADLRQEHGPLARHRIEHVETIPDDVVKMFGADAAAASMQPLHVTCFNLADRSDSWSLRLGDVRVDHGFRWGDIRAVGGVVALGSDWPIAPYDPRWIMADAQLRRRFDRPEAAPIHPEQALTALQTLEGFTTHAARASGEEDHRGRIAPGYDADLTIFAGDPLTCAPEDLGSLPVVGTVVGGALVGS